MMNNVFMWCALGILLFLFAFFVHRQFQRKNVWATLVQRHKQSTDQKLFSEAQFVTRFGAIENKSLLYKMDRMVLTSGIKKYLPHASGEGLILVMLLCASAGFLEGTIFFSNIFVALFLMVAQALVPFVLIKAMSGKTYNQIEDNMAIFLSILSNHAKGSSDIVTIMQRSAISLNGPLKVVVEQFVNDCERTGNVDVAFDYMKESVDNRQLQTILINLKNCMHYQANYEEVLMQMMGQVAAGLSAREDRKNILFSMKLTLVVISLTSVVIVWLIGAGLGIDVKGCLTGNVVGQALLCATGFLYLLVGVKMFGTDK